MATFINKGLMSLDEIRDLMERNRYTVVRSYDFSSLYYGAKGGANAMSSFKEFFETVKNRLEDSQRNSGKFIFSDTKDTTKEKVDLGEYNEGLFSIRLSEKDFEAQPQTVQTQPQAVAGVPTYAIGSVEFENLRTSIVKDVQNEFRARELEAKEKDLAEREKNYEAKQNGVIGMLVHYLSPVAQHLVANLTGASTRVAGVDNGGEDFIANEAIKVRKSEPTDAPSAEVVSDDLFDDEESDKLFALMLRFRKVEPRYIELIENVVAMAERGDAMYATAKSVLLK